MAGVSGWLGNSCRCGADKKSSEPSEFSLIKVQPCALKTFICSNILGTSLTRGSAWILLGHLFRLPPIPPRGREHGSGRCRARAAEARLPFGRVCSGRSQASSARPREAGGDSPLSETFRQRPGPHRWDVASWGRADDTS